MKRPGSRIDWLPRGAYVGAMQIDGTPSIGRRATAARVGRTLVHLILDLWVAIVCLIVWTVGLSLTLGLAVTVVGGAVALAMTLAASLGIGRVERARAAVFLGTEVAAPRRIRNEPGVKKNVIRWVIDSKAAWNALAYVFIKSFTGLIFFPIALSLWSSALFLVFFPFFRPWVLRNSVNIGFAVNSPLRSFVAAIFGWILLVAIAPAITLAFGAVNRWMVTAFLGPTRTDELRAQVVEVSERRTAAVEGAEAERRRIERDLHDGAQQRLVALGMTIGMAKEKLDSDPEAARALLNEAHTEAKSAMTELRSIARGIHPAVLEDRGLDAALSAIAARAPIPVTINVDLRERVGATIEGAAYYVVSEALTNIAKHAAATQAFVNVDRIRRATRDSVVVTVTDNGCGGATLTAGGGLAGLRDRVSGVGGLMTLTSPIGGPTTLIAEFPR